MGTQCLIDTSAVIKYLNQTFPLKGISYIDSFIETDCTISVISEIELQVWSPVNEEDRFVYKQFVAKSQIIQLDASIIAETINVRKNFRLKIADAITAATAITLNRTLVSDNDGDFTRVPSLKYINPRLL